MSENLEWEYRVETIGSAWSGLKDEELEAVLNLWVEEGWEIFQVVPIISSAKVRVVGRRLLTRATRRERSWPGD